jgi:hypothetical protein
MKDENGDVLDSHNILNTQKNYYSWLLNIHKISDVGKIAEQLVLIPVHLRLKLLLQSLKCINHQIPAELIQTGGEILCSKMHEVIPVLN